MAGGIAHCYAWAMGAKVPDPIAPMVLASEICTMVLNYSMITSLSHLRLLAFQDFSYCEYYVKAKTFLPDVHGFQRFISISDPKETLSICSDDNSSQNVRLYCA